MLYVIDTSVILSDPKALERLGGKDIVIPLVVLTELEAKRTHPELGYPARTALRMLEGLRKQYGGITGQISTKEGGSIRVELNNIDDSALPAALRVDLNDNKILAVASNLAKSGEEVTLLTKDLPLRLKASIAGISADDGDPDSEDFEIGFLKSKTVDPDVIDYIYQTGSVGVDPDDGYAENTGIILKTSTEQSALGRVVGDQIQIVKNQTPCGLEGRNAEQSIALDILCDPAIGIASIGGLAGSGKTVMALAAGIDAVKKNKYKRVIVFRPVYSVGGQDLGFLPGTAEEKMAPWSAAVYDAMESFLKPNEVRDIQVAKQIEILPLTHIRGRTLKGSYVVIDEAQNLDLMVLVTALSRMGEGSKVVLTHDVNQRDNLRVGKHDGIAKVISTLSGSELFAHVALTKSVRSKIADLVANSFDI